jgi:alkylation response protein AidB-like acyl-CoA dehydrogenase
LHENRTQDRNENRRRNVVSTPLDEFNAWLDDSWDPQLRVRDWWERLGMAGWAAPHWPKEAFGRGLSNAEAAQIRQAIKARGVLGPPGGLGLLLAGPTIYTHGTQEQIDRYLPDILCGRVAWCQLFSEPVAGSDLAGLQTRAVRDGEPDRRGQPVRNGSWRVTGQKVWTSAGHLAQLGMLIARTDPDAPKHGGVTWFVFAMDQPGVEVRPLREMTGRALFNEVFLTDAVARDADIVGGLHQGWPVTRTTLAFERSGLGAGSSGAGESSAYPGPTTGHLDRRAGDFTGVASARRAPSLSVDVDRLIALARQRGAAGDPLVRQSLARLHTEQQIGRYMALRSRDLRRAGRGDLPGMANMAKLRMSAMFRDVRETGLGVLGPRGTLHDYGDPAPTDDDEAREMSATALALWSPAPSIYGGTDEVQRNILGERVLGLPRDGGDDSTKPFRDLPRNV